MICRTVPVTVMYVMLKYVSGSSRLLSSTCEHKYCMPAVKSSAGRNAGTSNIPQNWRSLSHRVLDPIPGFCAMYSDRDGRNSHERNLFLRTCDLGWREEAGDTRNSSRSTLSRESHSGVTALRSFLRLQIHVKSHVYSCL